MKRYADEGAIRQAGLEYARLGWKIVLLHPKNKRPIGEAWQMSATDDEELLEEQFDKWPDANIGLLLGPASGVIDIEFDDEQGRLTAEALFAEVYTPTYKSSRSTHRLFRWSGDLPDVQKVMVDGLEVRIGGGGKAAQSVLPPSRHPTGAHYVWAAGMAPGEVELADVPESVAAKLANFRAGDVAIGSSGAVSLVKRVLNLEPVAEGTRNDALYKTACYLANEVDFEKPDAIATMLQGLMALNYATCRPPLPEAEVRAIISSASKFAKRGQVEKRSALVESFAEFGLAYDTEADEWFPGEWRLTVINSDPKCYRLHVPAFARETHDGLGEITLTVEQYRQADRVADAVQAATGTVVLDKRPGEWPAIWNGAKRKGRPPSEGIKSKLLATATFEEPPAVDKHYVAVAELMALRISNAGTSSDAPDGIGMPTRYNGAVWFNWGRMWAEAKLMRQVDDADLRRLKKDLGIQRGDFRRWPDHPLPGQARVRYCVLNDKHLARLDALIEDASE